MYDGWYGLCHSHHSLYCILARITARTLAHRCMLLVRIVMYMPDQRMTQCYSRCTYSVAIHGCVPGRRTSVLGVIPTQKVTIPSYRLHRSYGTLMAISAYMSALDDIVTCSPPFWCMKPAISFISLAIYTSN